MTTATQATNEDLGLSSGIEYDATITDAYFSFPPNYKAEVLVLVLELMTDAGEERQQFFTLGSNWEPVENGARISPINPRRQRIDEKSGLGNLVATAAAQPGALDALKKAAGGESPVWKSAAIWKGLTFGFAQRELTYTDRQTQEERKYSRLDVTAFLPGGLDGVDVGGGDVEGIADKDVEIQAALKVIAATSESYEVFVQRALAEVDGVEQSEEWSTKLLTDALYIELRTA
jgi:hypothetical protein